MTYDEFRRYRDDLLQGRRPLRLDCMNPQRSMAAWESRLGARSPIEGAATVDRALAAWSQASGWPLDRGRVLAGRGVRDLLAALLACLRASIDELWIPSDVYPVYGEIGRAWGYRLRSFDTLATPEWNAMSAATAAAAALLPVPLSPAGRWLRTSEADVLRRWLADSPRRLLLVDAVYTYDFAESRKLLEPLFATGQVAILWSGSKSWLRSNALGVAAVPPPLAAPMSDRIEPPTPDSLVDMTSRLLERPDLPRLQQEAFSREWRRIEPRLKAAVPEWVAPDTGYFSVVERPFRRLLDPYDVLAVPARVFGSTRDDLSVVTCLHDLAEHELS